MLNATLHTVRISAPKTFFNATTPQGFALAYSRARLRSVAVQDATSPLHELSLCDSDDCYLSEDGESGFVVRASGELVAVFSLVKGRGHALVTQAVYRGAQHLDCFDGYLPALYAHHGFVETNRTPNWTVGGPDVVYMSHRPCTLGALAGALPGVDFSQASRG